MLLEPIIPIIRYYKIDMTTRYYKFCLLILLLLPVGCSKSDSPTNTVKGIAEPINWTGSEKIYADFEGKKEYSMLMFYTDWCSYCRKMDEITFADPTVAGMINQYFNAVRINAESDSLVVYMDTTATGIEMRSIYEVGGYPTICFFDINGNLIARGLGYSSPSDFTRVLNMVLSGQFD